MRNKERALVLLALLPTLALAEPIEERLVNSLSFEEGKVVIKALETGELQMSSEFIIQPYPSYLYMKYECRDMSIAFSTHNTINTSACKVGGDWVFIY